MLFQPFQIISVERVDASELGDFSRESCGILCCSRGEGLIHAGGRDFRFSDGICLFIYDAGGLSLQQAGDEATLYWIRLKINHVDLQKHLHGRVLQLQCLPQSIEKLCREPTSFSTLYQLTELLLLEQTQQFDRSHDQLIGYDGNTAEHMDIYAALLSFLDANLQNDFTASQLAAAVGCSHRQLNNLLQKHKGCTTLEFVNEYRIQKARLYLMGSERTITQIAALTGFKSVHYFSRVFKKHTGVSPQSFRASCNSTETE